MKVKCGVRECDAYAIGSYAELPVCGDCMSGFIDGEAEIEVQYLESKLDVARRFLKGGDQHDNNHR